jgi:hypothetical protein
MLMGSGRETFEKCSILLKVKEGENMALTLHFVQPQEYIEYFADYNLSLTPRLSERGRFAKVSSLIDLLMSSVRDAGQVID